MLLFGSRIEGELMSTATKLVGAIATSIVLLSAPGPSGAAAPAPPPIEAFGRLPSASNVELSPSGHRVAFVSRTAAGRKLIVAEDDKPIYANEIADGVPGDNKSGRDGKIRQVEWVDDDHLLVTVEKTEHTTPFYLRDKYETSHVLAINLKTKTAFWIFQGQGFILQSVLQSYGFSTAGGRAYGFFAGQAVDEQNRPGHGINLYRVDLDNGQTEIQARGVEGELQRTWQIGGDGSVLASADYNALSQDIDLYEGRGGGSLARYKGAFGDARLLGQGHTPGTLVYAIPIEVGVSDYYEVALAKGAAPTRLFAGQRVAYPLFDVRTRLLSGVATGGDYPDRTYFDPVRQARWSAAKKAFPGRNVQLVSNDADFDRLIVQTEGDGDAGTYWLVDSAAGTADLYANIHPDIPPEAAGLRRIVSWKAADGLEIHGVLTLPPGRDPKTLPVIVMPHGEPDEHDDLSFDWLAAAFASRGYAVLQPNFRGSSGYADAFVRAGYGEWGRKMQTDISDGLADLAAKGVVDPKRACAVGWGFGGYAALAGATLQHGLYRCVVSIAGVSDLSEMRMHVSGRRDGRAINTRFWRMILASRPVGDGNLRAISPAELAGGADAPVLLIHGTDDTVVPIQQSEIMERALKNAGKPVELVRIEGEDHQISHEPTRVQMLKAAVTFVEKYDPPN